MPKTTDDGPSLFIPPIQWRRPGQGTFTFVESKDFLFRVNCVSEDGHYANPTATYMAGEIVAPPGEFYQAVAHRDGETFYSPLCDSMDEAKDACEDFRLHGRFPR